MGERNSNDDSAETWLRKAVEPLSASRDAHAFVAPLRAGEVVDGRFRIERIAGNGGMGTVYRAHDEATSGPVALKVLARHSSQHRERLSREGQVLAGLSHPAVVRYVAQGALANGSPYLAMEWLEGEDLAQRLSRSRLTLADALMLVRRACAGLAAAHARGVVHRDLKPSNLFLVGGEVSALKVIDFGVARPTASAPITKTGAVLGTLGYMSPEQARGRDDVDARTDIFSLGCVLFECLTGRPAFVARHEIAVIAKVLEEEPPRVSVGREPLGASPDAALDAIVSSMLAKDRALRPESASALLEQLERLGTPPEPPGPRPLDPRPSGLARAEKRLVSVIVGLPNAASSFELERTPALTDAPLEALAARLGAKLARLDGGGLLLVLSEQAAATDQATRAALCALAVRTLLPTVPLALATGSAEMTGELPVGDAIDRAAGLLMGDRGGLEGIVIDDVTAGLLDGRFEVNRDGHRQLLRSDRRGGAGLGAPRLLMGKRTPFVGRERDLAILTATFAECVAEEVSRSAVVTAPPGAGKTRLASEFLTRTVASVAPRVLVARCDPMFAAASLALASDLARNAMSDETHAGATASWVRLRDYLAERISEPQAARVTEFLAELIGVVGDDPPSPELAAARNDPEIMREQIRRALAAWIDAEAAGGPLLLVLDDMHWSDAPSLAWLEEAMKRLARRPFFVMVLGRPELRERHPSLLRKEHATEVALGGLTPRAAERLARAVVGSALSPEDLARAVERADGNAFYLEEFLRHVAEGAEHVPETVLAMAQLRLERLEPDARRVLRAASVFGEVCWPGGVGALLDDADAAWWLETLTERELLVRAPSSRYAGEREFVFRHALLRDAAYATWTNNEVPLAHTQAGAWLERRSPQSPLAIAEHFERGAEPERAIPWLARATRAALEADGFAAVPLLAQRGLLLGARGPARGDLLAARALAEVYGNGVPLDDLREALELLPRASAYWWLALASGMYAAAAAGLEDDAGKFLFLALATPATEATGAYGHSLFAIAAGLMFLGQSRAAWAILEKAAQVRPGANGVDPMFTMWFGLARCFLLINAPRHGLRKMAEGRDAAQSSVELAARCGSVGGEAMATLLLAGVSTQLGCYDEAHRLGERAARLSAGTQSPLLGQASQLIIGFNHLRCGRAQEADRLAAELMTSRDQNIVADARSIHVETLLLRGDVTSAIREGVLLAEETHTPGSRCIGVLVAADGYLATGRPTDALALLDKVKDVIDSCSAEFEILWRTLEGEALMAQGRSGAAREALAHAFAALEENAAQIGDLALRATYLAKAPFNARLLGRMTEWRLPMGAVTPSADL